MKGYTATYTLIVKIAANSVEEAKQHAYSEFIQVDEMEFKVALKVEEDE